MKKANQVKKLKFRLLCANKKCNYMLLLGEKPTVYLRKIVGECPVCRTKYEKNRTLNHRTRLSKKERLRLKKDILRQAQYYRRDFYYIRRLLDKIKEIYTHIIKKAKVFIKMRRPVNDN